MKWKESALPPGRSKNRERPVLAVAVIHLRTPERLELVVISRTRAARHVRFPDT